jgi:outer membrane protein OmpA-like peptidoglycan-associated protein
MVCQPGRDRSTQHAMRRYRTLLRGAAAGLIIAAASAPALAKPASAPSAPPNPGPSAPPAASREGNPGVPASQSASRVEQLEAALHAAKTDRGWRILLSADRLFGSSRDELDAAADPLLAQLAELIVATRPREVIVAGHTDSANSDDDNRAMSADRAHAVAAWLAVHTAKPRPHYVEQAFGRTRPLAPNHNADGSDNPDGRASNRRIEVWLRR